jgi:hypothetical protein
LAAKNTEIFRSSRRLAPSRGRDGVGESPAAARIEHGWKIAERKINQIASELWPDNGTDRQIRNAQARREAVLRLFSEGATVGNAPGTKWCAANALLEQLEWGTRARSPEGRFLRHISDAGGLKARALELVLDA